jgi:hypothetical protein
MESPTEVVEQTPIQGVLAALEISVAFNRASFVGRVVVQFVVQFIMLRSWLSSRTTSFQLEFQRLIA